MKDIAWSPEANLGMLEYRTFQSNFAADSDHIRIIRKKQMKQDKKEADIFKVENYLYRLPEEKIARFPLPERDLSKLLVSRKGTIESSIFRNLPHYLPEGSLLIFNDTKVVPARLLFKKKTGAVIEVFCLDPYDPAEYSESFSRHDECRWKCLIGNKKRWKGGYLEECRETYPGTVTLKAFLESADDAEFVHFMWDDPRFSFADILSIFGNVPLPPYIKRDPVAEDRERYQTIYAKYDGSVAAPTAGLHFTDRVIRSLSEKNIGITYLTLHVAAGTFRPVKHSDIRMHEMHTEHFSVTYDFVRLLLKHTGPVVPVGTTSVRTMESLYIIGTRILEGNQSETLFFIDQWDWKNVPKGLHRKEVLTALADWMQANKMDKIHASTRLMIIPGFSFALADAMITNFHQPGSTLLMLVAAYTGEHWKTIYNYALENEFRFLSYGDACLIFP